MNEKMGGSAICCSAAFRADRSGLLFRRTARGGRVLLGLPTQRREAEDFDESAGFTERYQIGRDPLVRQLFLGGRLGERGRGAGWRNVRPTWAKGRHDGPLLSLDHCRMSSISRARSSAYSARIALQYGPPMANRRQMAGRLS